MDVADMNRAVKDMTKSEEIVQEEVWPAFIDIPVNEWQFPGDFLEFDSPSRSQMPFEKELDLRMKGCSFIVYLSGPNKLAVSAQTILTASIFFHRYYARSRISNSYHATAAACLFVACKIEENLRKIEDLALMAARSNKAAGRIDTSSKLYWEWRDSILFKEEVVLAALCFDLDVDSPYEVAELLKAEFESQIKKDNKWIDNPFIINKDAIIKRATKFIEEFTCLPILLVHELKDVFAAAMVMAISVKDREIDFAKSSSSASSADDSFKLPVYTNTSNIKLPSNTFELIGARPENAYAAYRYLFTLIKFLEAKKHPYGRAVYKYPKLTKEQFADIANVSLLHGGLEANGKSDLDGMTDI